MKIGVSVNYKELYQYNLSYEQMLNSIDHIQINGLPAELLTAGEAIYKNVEELKKINPGLSVSLHAYKFNFTEKVERVLKIWIQLAKETILFASSIKAGFVNFHAGFGSGGTRIQHKVYREALVPVFEELVKTGCAKGTEIHLENLFPRPVHAGIRMLCDRTSDFELLFQKIDNPGFKLCYDYGHGNLDEYGIDILRRFSGRLGSIHAHDNDQMADIHLPIGAGTIDWKQEFEYLQEIDFKGPFILENNLKNQLKAYEFLKGDFC